MNESKMLEQTGQSSESRLPAVVGNCRNCGAELIGGFCAQCGQKDREVRRPFLTIAKDLVNAAFELDGRAYRSLYYLLTRPGFLSSEFVAGRQARYTPPLRLFLVLSIVLFALVSLTNTLSDISGVDLQVEAEDGEEMSREERLEQIRLDLQEDEDIQDMREALAAFELPFLSEGANARVSSFLQIQFRENGLRMMDDPAGFLFESLDYVTVFLLLMMPMLALIQRLLYLRSGHFFIEHLILALHNHSFLILVLLVTTPLDLLSTSGPAPLAITADWLNSLFGLWIVIYLYLSLKRFFGQGYFVTTIKFFISTLIYGIALLIGLGLFFLLVFFLS